MLEVHVKDILEAIEEYKENKEEQAFCLLFFITETKINNPFLLPFMSSFELTREIVSTTQLVC